VSRFRDALVIRVEGVPRSSGGSRSRRVRISDCYRTPQSCTETVSRPLRSGCGYRYADRTTASAIYLEWVRCNRFRTATGRKSPAGFCASDGGYWRQVSPRSLESDQQDGLAAKPFEGYASEEQRPPLASYAAMSVVFLGGCAAFLVAARRNRIDLPERISTTDLMVIGAATHKLSRLIAKDKITSFLRAPFRRYQDAAGPAELSEETRGEGLQAAVGELLGCPYCLGLWIAAGMTGGLVVAPRETRLVSSALAALTVSDFLQLGYAICQEKV
jgi:hypothetical protein